VTNLRLAKVILVRPGYVVTFRPLSHRFAFGAVLAAALFTLATTPLLKANGQMDISYSCTTGPKADATRAKDACREFLGLMQQQHPALRFSTNPPGKSAPSLQLEVITAGSGGLSVRSVWTRPDAKPVSSEILGVSVMDRAMSSTMQSNLLRRLLSANPLPF
jgi:hypothetical protein